jgi:hypothetical protein
MSDNHVRARSCLKTILVGRGRKAHQNVTQTPFNNSAQERVRNRDNPAEKIHAVSYIMQYNIFERKNHRVIMQTNLMREYLEAGTKK